LLLVLVGLVQPEWLKYLPLGGLEGLPNSTALSAEGVFLGQASTLNQPQEFLRRQGSQVRTERDAVARQAEERSDDEAAVAAVQSCRARVS
jgi:hypothetical protein